MTAAKALCLNMIVKNEMANLERCLASVVDHVACWVIGDTGSTDGTQDFIRAFFSARNVPGELHSFPFHDFEQARNAALDCAYASPLAYDYLLFDDADMELVVEDRDFRTKLAAPSYTVLQRSSIMYWNTRLVQRGAGARYRGVTHEYVEVPGGGGEQLHGIWYKDHASGANRADKFARDIRLLTEALEKEPDNHRYWFYLAQSYRDAGQTVKAAETYAKRAAMGGWDEEAWYARLQEARCLRQLGDEGGFLRQALAAFNQRPQRAEPLYDLARFYREKRMNDASALFAEAGLPIPRPQQDILFLEDFVYGAGLQEEYSIAANYSHDPLRKDRGFAACNWLTLDRTVPAGSRSLARSNLFFYVQPAKVMMPSFAARQVGFAPPDGYHPSNPSVTRQGDEILLVQRSVNVTLTEGGHYQTPNGEAERARNYLLRLNHELEILSSTEILPPADLPQPAFPRVLGFQDLRPFAWRGELWGCATVRELNPEGWYEQVLARIDRRDPDQCRLTDWRVLVPAGARRHEKNWMPRVRGDTLEFIYLCDPAQVVDERAATVSERPSAIAAEDFRGGSQAIAFDEGWLALIHEVLWRDGRRFYHHRFVWFDRTNTLRAVSRQFFLHKKGIEFAAGLDWHPDAARLLLSYGVDDRESWIATVDADDVRRLLEDAEDLPSAATLTRERRPAPHPEMQASTPAIDAGRAPSNAEASATTAASHDLPSAVSPEPAAEPEAAAAPAAPKREDTSASANRSASAKGDPVARSGRGKTIGLCMIVKNEAHIIRRCLESVRPLVDYILVEDTGSTDGTQAIVREYLEQEGLPGKVFEVPWQDFAHNRSIALATLRKNNKVDYALIMDADDLLVPDANFDPVRFKENLSKDFYSVEVRRATVSFHRGHIVSNRREFRYRGVLHEVLVGPRNGYSSGVATGFYISYGQEGTRSLDPEKYRRDAEVLERALRLEKDPWLRSRYTFYLAQSYFAGGDFEKSLPIHLKRTELGFWEEEVYWSYYRAACAQEGLKRPVEETLATYAKATAVCPTRGEALHEGCRLCREHGRFAEGYELAKHGLTLRQPKQGLFLEPWIYQYGFLDELAVNAFWIGRYDECLEACERLLHEGKCPEDMRARIEKNRDFAREKLAAARPLVPAEGEPR